MKKLLNYLLFLFSIFIIITVYYYFKSAVTVKLCKIDNNIPIKISAYSSKYGNDSVLVYIPYKIEISNNRLHKISIESFLSENELSSSRDMNFDKNGFLLGRENNIYILDGMLEEMEILKYFQLYYNKEVFPFCDKEFYFYKAFLLSKATIKMKLDWNQHHKIVADFENQSQNLYYKNKFKIENKTVDSLYKSDYKSKFMFFFKYGENKYSNTYKINYFIDSDKQELIDYSKMSQKELIEYMKQPATLWRK